MAKMSISGQPGNIKLAVRDKSGEEGGSRLQPDSMDLVLKTGPSKKLMLEGPTTTDYATRAVLPQLKVRVADVAGNFTDEGSCEVSYYADMYVGYKIVFEAEGCCVKAIFPNHASPSVLLRDYRPMASCVQASHVDSWHDEQQATALQVAAVQDKLPALQPRSGSVSYISNIAHKQERAPPNSITCNAGSSALA